jgi:uncharacterized protein YfiM (DUF2279 family)
LRGLKRCGFTSAQMQKLNRAPNYRVGLRGHFMKRFFLVIVTAAFSYYGFAQIDVPDAQAQTTPAIPWVADIINRTNSSSPDTIRVQVNDTSFYAERPYSSKRVKLVTVANITSYGATMVGLYNAWYSKYPQTNFHFFNDNREWKQVDKVGHMYSAYIAGYASMEMWRWTGISRKKRIWIGGLSGAAYQTIIEVLDGFSAEWGWSWGDIAANVAGSSLLIGQELKWDEQRIRLKFSAHKKKYGSPELEQRADKLFGSRFRENFIKDYNAQTYWLSGNLKAFAPQSAWPSWLNIAVGYGAENMFGGEDNIGRDALGNITFDRRDIKRYRQWYLAPDIDFTRIRTNSKLLKITFGVLNAFKFPTPSLEVSNGKMRVNLIHF